MRFADVVATSTAVAATRKRSEKIRMLAELLAKTAAEYPDELEAVVAFVAGEPRQGKIGVGWASISAAGGWEAGPVEDGADVAGAAVPALTVGGVDRAIT